ncbi:hypothetical protein [Caloramator sp. Dgby_cultured_2]|uniref:hypothetical protein n=1 Tax=Caloramator sp. Dgby_cultured_2 TaxID=3029174 RepID=UPI00237E4C24|nr:hypothetical protein [Caloramator sp. Dgby_cultured_2]WDU84195.1 hypothetical protein PWK10_07710 [Caloramator sp. Dgby_cultured_2]
MMTNLKAYPNVTVKIGDKEKKYKNNVVQTGLNWLLDIIGGLKNESINYIAVGDDSTQVTLGDTQLYNERTRKPITSIVRDEDTLIIETFSVQMRVIFIGEKLDYLLMGQNRLIVERLLHESLSMKIKII